MHAGQGGAGGIDYTNSGGNGGNSALVGGTGQGPDNSGGQAAPFPMGGGSGGGGGGGGTGGASGSNTGMQGPGGSFTLSGKGGGGAGGDAWDASNFGAGGGGGGDVNNVSAPGGISVVISNNFYGGNGGMGGDSSTAGAGGGGGGGAGLALTLPSDAQVDLSSPTIRGGDGGLGGNGAIYGGGGGAGGAGLILNGSGTVRVSGAIQGGAGATGGYGPTALGNSGAGGYGLVLANGAQATLSGSVTAGYSGTGVQASALYFTGTSSTLTLTPGALLSGAITVGTNSGGTLLSISPASIGNAIYLRDNSFLRLSGNMTMQGVISGNGALRITGDLPGTIALTSANTYAGGTIIDGGSLVINDDRMLGSGDLVIKHQGTLTVNDVWNTTRAITVGDGVGAYDNYIYTLGNTVLNGAITTTDRLTIDAGTGSITATNAGNQFNSTLALRGKNIAVSAIGNLVISDLSANSGSVALNALGSLVLQSGIPVVDAGQNDIAMTAQGGALSVDSMLAGRNISLEGQSVSTSSLQATNNLDITSTGAGALVQMATWTVGGKTSLNVAGDITLNNIANMFGGAVSASSPGNVQINGGLNRLTLGSVQGASLMANAPWITLTDTINTLGAQIYSAPVTLGANTSLLSGGNGNIGFASTVDGPYTLGITTGGSTSFGGPVGSTTALTGLAVDGGGTTRFGGNVTTTGAQSYNTAINLTANTQLTGSMVYLGQSVDGAYGLNIAGNLQLYGAIGGTTVLSSLNVSGATSLDGTIRAAGNVNLTGATTLAGDSTIAVSQGTGNVSLGQVDGGRSLALSGLGVSLGDVGKLARVGALNINAGNITLGGDINALRLTLNSLNDVALNHNVDVSGTAELFGGAARWYRLTGDFSAGSTTIQGGINFDVGNGGTTGSLTGAADVLGSLLFTRTTDSSYTGSLRGTGTVAKNGPATLTIQGDSHGFSGNVLVTGGELIVGGNAGSTTSLGGTVSVYGGATLGGHGTLTGNLVVHSGGHLAPGNSIGTLTVDGNAVFALGSMLDFELGRPGSSLATAGSGDSLVVGGLLDLGGTQLNITDTGGFGTGVYTLMSYGTLAGNSLTLGAVPGNPNDLKLVFDTADKKINLYNKAGVTLALWNANGQATSTHMGGGTGTWSLNAPLWANDTGDLTDIMQPTPGFAVFGGARGTVTIDNGAGQVSANGMQFASDGYVMQGGTLLLGNTPTLRVGDGSAAGAGMTATIDNVLAGASGITKTDAGTLVLNGANTFTGTTTVEGGRLSISSDANLGNAGNAVVLDGGLLQVTGSSLSTLSRQVTLGSHDGGFDIGAGVDFSLTQALGGSGALVKDGDGTLSLLHGASYLGGTQIRRGTLVVDMDSLHGDVANDGSLNILQNSDATYAGAVSGSGVLQKSGTGALTLTGVNTYSGGTLISAGRLIGNTVSLQGDITNHGALVFDQGSDGLFAGTLSGDGTATKTGSGTLVLNGSNSMLGGTQVQAGKLVVGDDAHASAALDSMVTVASGATLGGMGSIGGLNLAGTLTPGNSIGTLTINGDAVFQKGSTVQVEVNPDGSADRIVVNGHANLLGGSALAIGPSSGWAPNTDVTLLTATDGITGKFDAVNSQLAFLTPTLSYGSNTITLQLMRNDVGFASAATTANQRATGTAIESLGTASAVYQAVLMQDAGAARASFDQLSGEAFASTRTALINDSRYVRDAINRRLLGADEANQGTRATNGEGVTAWTSAWGHWGDTDSDGNAARSTSNGSGLLLGGDLTVGGSARLGAVVGHGQASVKVGDRDSDAHATTTWAGLYGDAAFGAFSLRGAAAYAWHDVDSHRNVAMGDSHQRLGASYHARSWQAYAEGSYDLALGHGNTLAPFVQLAHAQLDTDDAREQGGSASLRAMGASGAVSFGTLGLRDSWQSASGATLHASAGWQMAWGDRLPTSRMQFTAGGDAFGVSGVPVAQHAAVVDAGVSFPLGRRTRLDASYLGQFAGDARDQAARLSLTVTF